MWIFEGSYLFLIWMFVNLLILLFSYLSRRSSTLIKIRRNNQIVEKNGKCYGGKENKETIIPTYWKQSNSEVLKNRKNNIMKSTDDNEKSNFYTENNNLHKLINKFTHCPPIQEIRLEKKIHRASKNATNADEFIEVSRQFEGKRFNNTNKDINNTNKDDNNTNKDINNANKDINKTNIDINNANKDINKTNKDINNANKDDNNTNKDINNANKDDNNTNKDDNNSNKDINKTNKDINKTNKDINNANKDTNELLSKNNISIKEDLPSYFRDLNKIEKITSQNNYLNKIEEITSQNNYLNKIEEITLQNSYLNDVNFEVKMQNYLTPTFDKGPNNYEKKKNNKFLEEEKGGGSKLRYFSCPEYVKPFKMAEAVDSLFAISYSSNCRKNKKDTNPNNGQIGKLNQSIIGKYIDPNEMVILNQDQQIDLLMEINKTHIYHDRKNIEDSNVYIYNQQKIEDYNIHLNQQNIEYSNKYLNQKNCGDPNNYINQQKIEDSNKYINQQNIEDFNKYINQRNGRNSKYLNSSQTRHKNMADKNFNFHILGGSNGIDSYYNGCPRRRGYHGDYNLSCYYGDSKNVYGWLKSCTCQLIVYRKIKR